jgi:hypothetical protein
VGESVFQIAPNAAAAYSLRSLTGGDPKVVRVRRDTDNAEQDFTASGVSSGALTSFTNADYAKYTSDFSSGDDSWGAFDDVTETGNIDGIGGLDDNLRLAIGSATSNHRAFRSNVLPVNQKFNFSAKIFIPSTNSVVDSIMIRDASNNVIVASTTPTQDEWVTVTANNVTLTNAQLRVNLQDGGTNNFAGNGSDVIYLREVTVTQVTSDGFVETWYDQSGNGRDSINTTATQQPIIVDAGVFQDGLKFTHTDTTNGKRLFVPRSAAELGEDFALIWVGKVTESDTSINNVLGGTRGTQNYAAGTAGISIKSSDGTVRFVNEDSTSSKIQSLSSTTTTLNEDSVVFATYENSEAGPELTLQVDAGNQLFSFGSPYVLTSTKDIGIMNSTASNGTYRTQESTTGVCREVLVYDTHQGDNRVNLVNNINNQYDLF